MQRFPLLAWSLASYCTLQALTTDRLQRWDEAKAFNLFYLPSGDVWCIRGGELFIGASTLLLFIEIIRSTRINTASLTNHALSVLVFVAALMLFVTQPGYGNSIFFLTRSA